MGISDSGGAKRAIQREAARILRHMGQARLERRASGDYALSLRPGGRVRLTAAADTVAAFAARGWIALADDRRYAIAAEGEAWLRRAAGPSATAFRNQHGEVEALPGGLRIDHATAPLDFLKRHIETDGTPFLSPLHCEAADRLQTDFERAQLRPRVTRDPSVPLDSTPRAGAGGEHRTASALDAKRRCLAALDAAGPGLSDLLFDVVCTARGLNEAERGFGWPQRSAKTILRLALDRLAAHYGLVSGTRRAGRIEAWAMAEEG
ncbi:hypothetical protein sos41_32280 [Alphaproteobacteria bacterium SO-S41]|nr:hypothetical protein sos41_32280 [Alphaproteobacteria bacterium SO-S41]